MTAAPTPASRPADLGQRPLHEQIAWWYAQGDRARPAATNAPAATAPPRCWSGCKRSAPPGVASGAVLLTDANRRHHTHAAEIAAERLGLAVLNRDWLPAVLTIIASVAGEDSPAVFIERSADGREIWRVPLGRHAIPARVVYEPTAARIITVIRQETTW